MNSAIAEHNRLAMSEFAANFVRVKQRSYGVDCEQTARHLAAWAQRASGANGFGEIGLCTGPFPFADQRTHQQPAPRNGSASLREILSAMVDAVRDWTRRCSVQWKRYQLQSATYRALGALDARTLHDIGLDRSELRSIAVELSGHRHPTRAHALVRVGNLSI